MSEQFAVDGGLGREKLEELLALGHENQHLDYKKHWDLAKSSMAHRLDLVMSVAAFSNTRLGGYVVVGVDDRGSTGHTEREIDASQFDEAQLSQLISGYLSGRPSLTVRMHEYDGRPVAVIYVAPSGDDLPVIFLRDGELQAGNPKAGVKFRRGQLYVRRGTQCRAAEHADWAEILARREEAIRAHARGPINDLLHRLMAAAGEPDRGLTADTPIAVDFDQDLEVFSEAVTTVHPSQDGQLRRLLRRRVRGVDWDPETHWEVDGVSDVVDRLLVVGAIGVREERDELVKSVIEALTDLYRRPIAAGAGENGGARLWRTVGSAVAALGGLAVRERAWGVVRLLSLPPNFTPVPDTSGFGGYYVSWLRHAVTMAARANLLVTNKDGRHIPGGLVRFARQTASRVPILVDDVGGAPEVISSEFEPTDRDPVLDSICQFDYLWCVLTVLAAEDADSHQAMPGFSAFYSHRTRSVVIELVNNTEMRRLLAPEASDRAWAGAFRSLDQLANDVARQVSWHDWSAIDLPAMQRFLETHGLGRQ